MKMPSLSSARLLLAVLPALCAVPVHAQAQKFDFAWTGFFEESDSVYEFNPTASIQGQFQGQDSDGDRVIELNEIWMLKIDDVDLLHCTDFHRCAVNSFSYREGGALSFGASYSVVIDGSTYGSFSISAPNQWRVTGDSELPYYSIYYWTMQTAFSITPSLIPEPSAYHLLGTGLLILGAMRRSARRP